MPELYLYYYTDIAGEPVEGFSKSVPLDEDWYHNYLQTMVEKHPDVIFFYMALTTDIGKAIV